MSTRFYTVSQTKYKIIPFTRTVYFRSRCRYCLQPLMLLCIHRKFPKRMFVFDMIIHGPLPTNELASRTGYERVCTLFFVGGHLLGLLLCVFKFDNTIILTYYFNIQGFYLLQVVKRTPGHIRSNRLSLSLKPTLRPIECNEIMYPIMKFIFKTLEFILYT